MRFRWSQIFLTSLLLFSSLAHARDIVLHLSLIDNVVLTETRYHQMNWFLNKEFPDHLIWGVPVNVWRFRHDTNKIRDYVTQRMTALPFTEGDKITHLVVDIHGNTNWQGGQTMSGLQPLGSFGVDGPNENLRKVLDPLRGHFADDAVIVLNSCLTMEEAEQSAISRNEGLFEYLGIKNGQIYGSNTSETSDFYPHPYHYLKYAIYATMTFWGLNVAAFGVEHSPTLGHIAIGPMATAALLYAGRVALTWSSHNIGIFNQGLLSRFKEGKVDQAIEVDKQASLKAIYHRNSCEYQLMKNPELNSAHE
jgi:hypothetical protein